MPSAPSLVQCMSAGLSRTATTVLPCLHDPGTDLEASCTEVRVAHALAVRLDVDLAFCGLRALARMGLQRCQRRVHAPFPEFRATRLRPRLSGCPIIAQEVPGRAPKPLGCVVEVHDLDGAREQFAGHVPNPLGAVAEYDAARRLREAAPLGFPPNAAGEGGLLGIGVAGSGAVDRGRAPWRHAPRAWRRPWRRPVRPASRRPSGS